MSHNHHQYSMTYSDNQILQVAARIGKNNPKMDLAAFSRDYLE